MAINSINTVTAAAAASTQTTTKSAEKTSETTKKAASSKTASGVIYEKSSDSRTDKASNKTTSKTDNAAIVAKLKADAEQRTAQLRSIVEQMMTKQMSTLGDDYGYQMWLCEYPGAVRADGALGQYILIIPDKDMVVVITECTLIDGRRQRRLVWNRLLPETGDQALVPGKDYKRLQKKQRSYQLPLVQGKAASSLSQK